MADKQTIISILVPMSILPNCPSNTDAVVEAFYLVLRDLDDVHVKAAAAQYLSTATFFPTPGNIRQIAIDLDMAARGIPTPAEAWAGVLDAVRHVDAVFCQTGAKLRQRGMTSSGGDYWQAVMDYKLHTINCRECQDSHDIEVYPHPVVEQTVKRLGGRRSLFTDNAAADRARFIEAYREMVSQGAAETARLPEVGRFIDSRRTVVKQITERMTK